jgi:hypothetical protein
MHFLIFAFNNGASGETDAPSWLPLVALAIPITIMLLLVIWAIKGRRRFGIGRRAQAEAIQEDATTLGSAPSISDGGLYSSDALLKAMAIKPADYGPTDDEPYDEGWGGTMLGLKSKISYSTTWPEPHLFWGKREVGQVFIRMGPDEKGEGTDTFTNRHSRDITVVRVDAPKFAIVFEDGAPSIREGDTPALSGIIGTIDQNVGIWGEGSAYGGPEGIVVNRPGTQYGHFWIYDLWLAERIARILKLPPLADARVGPAWIVPYGLGRRSVPKAKDW